MTHMHGFNGYSGYDDSDYDYFGNRSHFGDVPPKNTNLDTVIWHITGEIDVLEKNKKWYDFFKKRDWEYKRPTETIDEYLLRFCRDAEIVTDFSAEKRTLDLYYGNLWLELEITYSNNTDTRIKPETEVHFLKFNNIILKKFSNYASQEINFNKESYVRRPTEIHVK